MVDGNNTRIPFCYAGWHILECLIVALEIPRYLVMAPSIHLYSDDDQIWFPNITRHTSGGMISLLTVILWPGWAVRIEEIPARSAVRIEEIPARWVVRIEDIPTRLAVRIEEIPAR